MPRTPPIRVSLMLVPLVLGAMDDASVAQDASSTATTAAPTASRASTPAKLSRDKYGSPLDTLMTTHLWTDVPPARDFVTQTRPDKTKQDYTPLTGVDPDRPKPRDKANISALQAELESDMAKNEAKGRVLRPTPKRKIKPEKP